MLRYDYDLFSLALGKRVRELRKERGLSLRALANEHGYHLTSFERLEQGKGISVRTILRLAETFQIPVEELIASLGTVKSSPREKRPRKQAK